MTPSKGSLVLIPCFLGDEASKDSLSPDIERAMTRINHYIVENEKSARKFIKRICPDKNQSTLWICELDKHGNTEDWRLFTEPFEAGHSVGLLSEAGCPAVADPGAGIVRLAHEKQIPVYPLPGPSSILLGLMASGMNGQNFAFRGYLPIESKERSAFLKKLEQTALTQGQTQIFIETPYRNDKLLETLLRVLQPDTRLCVAADLTLPTQEIFSASVARWHKIKISLHRRPAIFLIGKP